MSAMAVTAMTATGDETDVIETCIVSRMGIDIGAAIESDGDEMGVDLVRARMLTQMMKDLSAIAAMTVIALATVTATAEMTVALEETTIVEAAVLALGLRAVTVMMAATGIESATALGTVVDVMRSARVTAARPQHLTQSPPRMTETSEPSSSNKSPSVLRHAIFAPSSR
jgi:hypothetical protein